MDFRIDYEDDLDLALALLIECAKKDPRIVADPAPWAKVTALNDSTVTVTLRAWTNPDGYIDTRFDLIKVVKEAFQGAGLTFAFPQQVAVETRPWSAPPKDRQTAAKRSIAIGPAAQGVQSKDGEAARSTPARPVNAASRGAGQRSSRPRR